MNLNRILKLCTVVLFILYLAPHTFVHADGLPTGTPFKIIITSGNANMSVNGTPVAIDQPYVSANTTMVPLKIFTTGMGATVTWNAASQIIGLQLGSHDIELTLNKKQALVNGHLVKLSTAAEFHHNKLNVPLRFVSENLGAKVSFNLAQKQTILQGIYLVDDSIAASLNIDAGKTKIGDSYYNWSLNYPTDLVKISQSDNGDTVTFTNTNNDYNLNIQVAKSSALTMSATGLLQKLESYIGPTLISESTAINANGDYAQVISRGKDGDDIEARAYFKQGNIYYISMDVLSENDFTNQIKRAVYDELLDSFKLSFDSTDLSIKDLAVIKNGFRTYTNDDFGFQLQLPANWTQGSEASPGFNFNSDSADTYSIYVSVSSISAGDTLAAWVAREDADFDNTFTADYGSRGTATAIDFQGKSAMENTYSEGLDGDWITDDSFYVMNGNLKYNIELIYPMDSPQTTINAYRAIVTNHFTFTGKINPAAGFIVDDLSGRTDVSTIANSSLGLTIAIPDAWSSSGDSSDTAEGNPSGSSNDSSNDSSSDSTSDGSSSGGSLDYDFLGGQFSILASDVSTDDMISEMKDSIHTTEDTKLISSTATTFIGLNATEIVYQTSINEVPVTTTAYIFSRHNKNYMLIYGISDAVATHTALQTIQNVLDSIQFIS